MQKYDTYKPSNIEWIGEIPSHWNLYPLLHFADSEKYSFVDGPFGSDLKNEEYVDDGIPLIQLNNIGIGKHKLDTLKFITDEKSKQLFKHRIYSGDVVIAKMAEPVARATRVSNQYKMYVIVADCIRFKNDVNKIDSDYLIYSLNSDYLKTQAEFESTGTTRIRIGLNTAKKLRICYPPLQEQQAIVNYLDEKTTLIDELIAQKQSKIELLKEQSTALINQAVTKGLNAEVEMKYSGEEWLGYYPKDWSCLNFGVVCKLQQGLQIPFGDRFFEKGEDCYEYITTQSIHNPNQQRQYIKSPKKSVICYEDDIIYGRTGNTGEVVTNVHGVFHNNFFKIDFNRKKINKDYLIKFLNNSRFKEHILLLAGTTTIPDLNHSSFFSTRLLIPPLSEQQAIVAYLDEQTALIDKNIELESQKITTLKEYRQSLISAVVTGKICVIDN